MLNAIVLTSIAFSFPLCAKAEEAVNYADYYGVPVTAPAVAPTVAPTVAPAQDSKVNEITEMPIGSEFAVTQEPVVNGSINELMIKNEYPESLKVVFESDVEKIEIYLNAYESKDRLSFNTSSNYKIKVYNIYNDYLGYIRSSSGAGVSVRISPFLLVKDLVVETPAVKFVKEEQQVTAPSIIEEKEEQQVAAPNITEEKEVKSEAVIVEKPVVAEFSKHHLRVANISDSQVHIDINEADGQALGEGWTVANDIYEPQFLNLQSQPIQISEKADLIVTKASDQAVVKKKANELSIDEKGNYVWLIDNVSIK